MRRASVTIAIAVLAVALMSQGALAKGLSGNATVEGKGLDKPITLQGDDHKDDGFMSFMGFTGLMGGLDGSSPYDWSKKPPTKDLGPRYTVTWNVQEFDGPAVHILQYLYPYAEGGPLVFTPTSARIFQSDIPTGWYEAPFVLRTELEARGLPATNPDPGVAAPPGGAAESAAEASSTLPYVFIVAIAGLLVIGVVAKRIRPRPAKAS